MTVLEAYALGKPVIGARIGGIPEIVRDEVTGLLFEPGSPEDLIGKLSTASGISKEGYKEMAENAKKFASGLFSPDSHYEKLMTIYTELIKK